MQAYHIGGGEELRQGHEADAVRGDPVVVGHDIRGDYFRSERAENGGNSATYAAQADDTHSDFGEQKSHPLFPCSGAHQLIMHHDIADKREDEAEGQLRDRFGGCGGRVEHSYAEILRGGEIHVVEPGAAAGDDLQMRHRALHHAFRQRFEAGDESDGTILGEQGGNLGLGKSPAKRIQHRLAAGFMEGVKRCLVLCTEGRSGDENFIFGHRIL